MGEFHAVRMCFRPPENVLQCVLRTSTSGRACGGYDRLVAEQPVVDGGLMELYGEVFGSRPGLYR